MADIQKTIEIVFGAKDDGVSLTAQNLKTSLDSTVRNLSSVSDKLISTEGAVLALGAAFIGTAVVKAGEFGNKINEIGTVAGTSKDTLSTFSNEILKYGQNSNKSLLDINEAIYQAISAGISYKDSLGEIKIFEELAVGGRAQLSDATDVLIGSMNSYGISSENAAEHLKTAGEFSDAMFVAVQKGATTIPELATKLGDITPTASAAGVSFESLMAAIAAVTAAGIKTPQAITSINQALISIINPSQQAAKLAEELGIAFNAASLREEGLPSFLKKVQEATGGSVEKLTTLFGSVEALKGVLVLGADKAGVFADTLEAMKTKAGVSSKAAADLSLSWENVTQKLSNAADISLVTFGKKVADSTGTGLSGVAKLFNSFTVSLQSGAFDPVFTYINTSISGLTKLVTDFADNLPAAMSGFDWNPLFKAFDGLGSELKVNLELIFGHIDVSTPEGVKKVIESLVNGITSLTQMVTGVVSSFQPYSAALGGLIRNTEDLGAESNKQLGAVLGIAKGVETFGTAIGALANIFGNSESAMMRFFGAVSGLVTGFGNELAATVAAITIDFKEFELLTLKLKGVSPFGDREANNQAVLELERELDGMKKSLADTYSTADEGYKKFWDSVTGTAKTAGDGIKTVKDETVSAVVELDKFEPINLGDVDFVAKAMERLGIAAKDTAKQTENMASQASKITLPDGMVKITDEAGNISIKMDYAKKSSEGYFDTIKDESGNVIDHIWIPTQQKATAALNDGTKALLDAQKAADDYAIKVLEANNRVKIAGIENWGKINVAQIEADVKIIDSMFKSIDSTVQTTGKSITDLWGLMSKTDDWDKTSLQDSIRKQENNQAEALKKQNELIDAQITLLKARADKINSGDALIKIEATGLKQHLEKIFEEILKETQIKASEQGLNLLLGFAQ